MVLPRSPAAGRGASLSALIAAFAAIYLIWGSTFLAIRLAVETLPPLTMIGIRSVVAGVLLVGFALLRGAPRPTAEGLKSAALVGTVLFVGCHGLLAWAQTRIPSGQAAVLLATIPLWVPAVAWLVGSAGRPGWRTVAGLAIGFAGVVLLLAPKASGAAVVDPLGGAVALLSALFWAVGTVLSSRSPSSSSPVLAAGMQLLAGGVAALVIGALLGEWNGLSLGAVSLPSLLGLGYLITFGSLGAFGAYTWLLQVCAPEKVATYAYVNPPVALVLGAATLGEPLGLREGAATLVILGAVAMVMLSRSSGSARPAPDRTAAGVAVIKRS